MDARKAQWYDPSSDLTIGVMLARVRTPEEAVEFVERYGLLVSFENASAAAAAVGAHQMGIRPADVRITADFERRERTDDIIQDARNLADVFRTAMLARGAAEKEDLADRESYRESLRRDMDRALARDLQFAREKLPDYTDWRPSESPEVWMSRMVTASMNRPIERSRAYLVSTAPGRFEIRLMAPTLLDYCYLSVAHNLASEPLADCPECGRVFVVEDKRQRFCEPKCAGRSRFRAFKARPRTAGKGTTKGVKRGKKTRTR